jgi:DNA-binding transcriptional LysR family regulator
MDTRRLRYFLQIVDSGSVSRAAKVLGLAQPAVSQQIAVLEHELKVRLLNRSAKGVTPTLAGYRLYDRARRIVRQVEGLRFELMDDVLSGTVTIGLAPSISLLFGLPCSRR